MTHGDTSEASAKDRVMAIFEQSGIASTYERGESVMRFSSEEPSLFLLSSGTAALQVVDQDQANELNVTHLAPGDVFGSISQDRSANNQIDMYVLAKTQCVVIRLTAQQLAEKCANDPAGIFAVYGEHSRTSLRSLRKVGQLAFFDVRGRVSSALVELCGLPGATTHPDGYMLTNTRVEIAAMVGCTREMVGRVLKQLSGAGLISIHGRKTLVHVAVGR